MMKNLKDIIVELNLLAKVFYQCQGGCKFLSTVMNCPELGIHFGTLLLEATIY